MAITFIEQKQRKRHKTLFLILGFLTVVFVGLLVQRLLKEPFTGTTEDKAVVSSFRKPEIDFKILQNPILKDLELFEKIKPFEGEKGRENPFIPY